MFQDFQRKFRQRMGTVLLTGALQVLRKFELTVDGVRREDYNITTANGWTWSVASGRAMYIDNNCNLQFTNLGSGVIAQTLQANGYVYTPLIVASSANNAQIVITGANSSQGSSLTLSGKDHASGGSFTLAGVTLTTDTAVVSSTIKGVTAFASATTNLAGGSVVVRGGDGASGSAGAAHGGHVRIGGGTKFGTGTAGTVQLGYDGSVVTRITVRNTILGLNGYTSSAADPTTTDLATAGDFGIHKNTTSGTVFLAFNDAGTIRKVALA